MSKILSIASDAKTIKGQSRGYLTAIAYLSSGTTKGKNLCKHASEDCLKFCLGKTSGRMRMNTVQRAQKERALLFVEDRAAFMKQLESEIIAFQKRADRKGLIPAIRLNGSTDIDYSRIKIKGQTIFERFPTIQFYDYTKDFDRLTRLEYIHNYDLTFSHSGANEAECRDAVALGFNVAIPYHNPPKGPSYIDGDETDLRFLDVKGGMVVTLKVKGTKTINNFLQGG